MSSMVRKFGDAALKPLSAGNLQARNRNDFANCSADA
jgi:hypothetical protein